MTTRRYDFECSIGSDIASIRRQPPPPRAVPHEEPGSHLTYAVAIKRNDAHGHFGSIELLKQFVNEKILMQQLHGVDSNDPSVSQVELLQRQLASLREPLDLEDGHGKLLNELVPGKKGQGGTAG